MSAFELPVWVESNALRLQNACKRRPTKLEAAANEVDQLLKALTETGQVQPVLNGLLDLLLELPQTGELAGELLGGTRLHPDDHPSIESVAQTLRIVRNTFIQSVKSEQDKADALAMQLLDEPYSSPNGNENATEEDQ